MKCNTCSFSARLTRRGGRTFRLRRGECTERTIGETLRLEAPVDHHLAGQLDGFRIGRIQEQHRRCGARIEALLAHASQQIAHRHRHIAEVDVHRAWRHALVTHGAVIGDIGELIEVPDGYAASRLLFVQERFDQQRGRQNLVTRRIEQVGTRHMRRAHGLALAAAQAVLDGIGNRVDVRLLHDERLVAHQVEAGRLGIAQIAAGQQLALVEAPLRIDAILVAPKLCASPRPTETRAW